MPSTSTDISNIATKQVDVCGLEELRKIHKSQVQASSLHLKKKSQFQIWRQRRIKKRKKKKETKKEKKKITEKQIVIWT
jgi:hypothetical protein